MNRRRFLAGVSTAAAVGLTGCSSSEDGESSASNDLPRPEVDEGLLDSGGWERADGMKDAREVADLYLTTVTAFTRTDVYEKAALRDRVREDTLGSFDRPLAMFFASRTSFDPGIDAIPGSGDVVIDRAKEQANDTIVGQMEERGLSDVERIGETTLEVDTGEVADVHRYGAQFEYESMTFPMAEGEALRVPAGSLDIEGESAIWHNGEYLIVAGGALPAEDFEETIERSVTDAITVSVSIDLGLEPDRLHEELRDLIRSVR